MFLYEEFGEIRENEPICHIIGAADFDFRTFDSVYKAADFVIAADGGYDAAKKHSIKTDIVLGDFDSLGYVPEHENAVVLPAEKDDTDVLFAVKKAFVRGYKYFFLHGCYGGRPDHTLANMQALVYLCKNGGRGCLAGEGYVISAIRNEAISFSAEAEGMLSVFSAGEKAIGVTLKGLKYPLCCHTLTNFSPIGVSNEFTGAKSSVSVKDGTLIVMWESK